MSPIQLLNLFGLLFIALFIFYFFLILFPFAKRKPYKGGDHNDFDWHVVIPCLNEELTLKPTVERLIRRFPFLKIWVIDDASSDATLQIAQALSEQYPAVNIIQRCLPDAQKGKGAALNSAYDAIREYVYAQGLEPSKQIFTIVDADGDLSPNCFDLAAGPEGFSDPSVGGLQVAVWMKNRGDRHPYGRNASRFWNFLGSQLLRMQDIEFRTTIAAMQLLRRKTHSVGLGGNGQFARLTALEAIAAKYKTPWHDALLEDFELGLHIKLVGFRNEYVHDAYVAQEAVPSFRRYIRQRARWAQGGMQCTKYLPTVIMSSYFTNTALVETSYFLILPFIQIIGLFLWPTLFVYFVYLVVVSFSYANLVQLAIWTPVIFIFSVAPFIIWPFFYRRDERASLHYAFRWAFFYWLYIYLGYIVCCVALFNFLRGRKKWDKTERIERKPRSRRK